MLKTGKAELSYDHHIAPYRGFLKGDATKDAYWHHQAQYIHAVVVCDAIRDVHQRSIFLAQSVQNTEAEFQLKFGVGRRTKFIWLSLREIVGLIQPNRKELLLIDDAEQAARALNVIYINIRGSLDNFAWCLLSMFASEPPHGLPPSRVNLFGSEFQRALGTSELVDFIDEFADWNKDLKERRDPAAHRIPLSVPPAALDEKSQPRYQAALSKYNEVLGTAISAAGAGSESEGLFDEANSQFVRLQRIGSFIPVFVHHPDEGLVSIYPVVPTDIAMLAQISSGLLEFIFKRAGK